MHAFPVIVGCTASGKSDLALAIARSGAALGLPPVELVSADSMQVYRGMDIGTAKPTARQRAEAPHHLIDIREPTDAFSVDEWLGLAEGAIAEIRSRGRLPVVVGGSLLHVRALLEGLFEGPAPDPALRDALRALGPEARRAELERADPAAAARIHPNDERRTIRALEVHRTTGRPISEMQSQWGAGRSREDALVVRIEWPTEALNRRINARVRAMADAGLEGEVRGLWSAGRLGAQAREAIGYSHFASAFEALGRPGDPLPAHALEETLERIKVDTRRFAKNQRTWLRRLGTISPSGRQVELAGDAALEREAVERVATALGEMNRARPA